MVDRGLRKQTFTNERYAGAEKVKKIEKTSEGAFLLSEALRYGATPKELVLVSAGFLGIAPNEIDDRTEICPTELNFKARVVSASEEKNTSGYRRFLMEQLKTLPEIAHEKREPLTRSIRDLMWKRQPARFWRYDPSSRIIAAELFELKATPRTVAKAMSLHLYPYVETDDTVSTAAVGGWHYRSKQDNNLQNSDIPAFLRSGLAFTNEDRAEPRSIAVRLMQAVNARKQEHKGWQRSNEARAVVAAILEYYSLHAHEFSDRTRPSTGAQAAAHLLRKRFNVTVDFDALSQAIVGKIQQNKGAQRYIQKLRDGVYFPDEAECQILFEKAKDLAGNAHLRYEATMDANYVAAAYERNKRIFKEEEWEKLFWEQLEKRKSASHGIGPPILRSRRRKG